MLDRFKHIVVLDSEFDFGGHDSFEAASRSGERPHPTCLVAKELRSGRIWRLFRGEFEPTPPFPIGPETLCVAFYSSADWGVFIALGWPLPANIVDPFIEFRNQVNGLTPPAGFGLVGALVAHGLDHLGVDEKHDARLAIIAGNPDRNSTLNYCQNDVLALERLFRTMAPNIDLPRALLRGRYMKAAAWMEWHGITIDTDTLALLRAYWTDIQDELIAGIDSAYHCFDGRTFKRDWWARFLAEQLIPWPLLESGNLDLSDETFRQMAKAYPIVSPMRELRSSLSDLRLNDLAVGGDGRNRTILSAFRARSGRNAPSNTRFIFGPSVWLRSVIKPPPGYGLAYVDWSQQEFGIAAVLSGDQAMQQAYLSGDPYLAFAKQAGAAPSDATKQSHGVIRELYKTCALGVQYGMEAPSLAARIGQPPIVARDLLRAHRETYRAFWKWSDAALDYAMLTGGLHTVFGWRVHVGEKPNPRSLRNFPMQANGAEMLRLACCLATERGIEVCAPVHDAVLICAPLERLEDDIVKMRAIMAEASRIILNGFELRTDCPDEVDEEGNPIRYPHVIRYPRRFMDGRGAAMWDQVMRLIAKRTTMPMLATEVA
jgi:DNA polymerase I